MAPFFAKMQKKGHTALPQTQHVTHTEIRKDSSQRSGFLHPIHNKASKLRTQNSRSATPVTNGSTATSPARSMSPAERPLQKRKNVKQTPRRQEWGSEDESSEEDASDSRKRRRKQVSAEPDSSRTIRSRIAFAENENKQFQMVHAADVANLSKTKAYKLAFPMTPRTREITLQYPSGSQRERYELVEPNADDEFKPLNEIREVIETTISHYLPIEVAEKLSDDSTGIVRKLKRAAQRAGKPASQESAGDRYLAAIEEWNDTLSHLKEQGKLEATIDKWTSVDLELCERILTQTYARTVSLEIGKLKQYKSGTDNVYGELLPNLISKILKTDVQMKSNQIFVDLGSGVGNVVLQAALEVGCESWGCEEMPNPSQLADLQKQEFEARCRLWGLSIGEIHLEKGDFRTNDKIRELLPRADVVLVNNQAFTPDLNDSLTRMFLDLKDGAKVVSLKSFAPVGNQSQARTAGAINNILDVTRKSYGSNSVSWAGGDGTYFVATKDTSRLKCD